MTDPGYLAVGQCDVLISILTFSERNEQIVKGLHLLKYISSLDLSFILCKALQQSVYYCHLHV